MHAIVTAPGYQQVITHVFVDGDPYLDNDAVFAVKSSLVGRYETLDDAALAKKLRVSNPFQKLEFDFRLSPDDGTAARKKIAASDVAA
jgi:protocatechuate 3,4-dioxygenase beta subunit